MHKPIINNVCLSPVLRSVVGHGRCGTAVITLAELESRLGAPHLLGSGDDKITARWHLDTPRGPVEISDYWWNGPREQSIRGSYRACLWAAAWMRNRLQIQACVRGHYELAQSIRYHAPERA
jgi:hypothetical protein